MVFEYITVYYIEWVNRIQINFVGYPFQELKIAEQYWYLVYWGCSRQPVSSYWDSSDTGNSDGIRNREFKVTESHEQRL